MKIQKLGDTGKVEKSLNSYEIDYVDEYVIIKSVDIVNLRYMDLKSAKEIEEKAIK